MTAYFGRFETETGVIVSYDQPEGRFKAVPICHPDNSVGTRYYTTSAGDPAGVYCQDCGRTYTTEAVKSASNRWAAAWTWEGQSDLQIRDWAAAWLGIDKENVIVEIRYTR